jgi:hypothetical protein
MYIISIISILSNISIINIINIINISIISIISFTVSLLLFVLFGCYLCCSRYYLFVNVYCHRVTTKLQLINISFFITSVQGTCSSVPEKEAMCLDLLFVDPCTIV